MKNNPSKKLHRRLVWIYIEGSLAAVTVVFFLVVIGLELSWAQLGYILSLTPLAVALYILPDIYMINRHYRPIGEVLEVLERGDKPTEEALSAATIRALNLPFLTFTRVTLFHGPAAAISTVIAMVLGNVLFGAGLHTWQILIFFTIVLCFASPTHAMFEFFAASRAIAPVTERLSSFGGLSRDQLSRLKSTSLRNKLLYLSLFVTALPLLFFAVSIIFKVNVLLANLGVHAQRGEVLPLWIWLFGVVAVCMSGALVMSVLTASEVSRSAAKLIEAMNQVEQGDLSVRLSVTGTDEYANLFRGFNFMTEGLREEVRILEMSQDLMGELHLDVLLERIIRASTQLLDADRSTLFVYDAPTDQLFSRFAQGLNTREIPLAEAETERRPREIRFPASDGIAGSVFRTGRTENIADAYTDPRFNQDVDRKTGYRTSSILAMPIVNKAGQRIGVTEVLNKRGGRFTAKDETRLRSFTAQIAIALENAKLFDDVLRMKNYNDSILRSSSNGIITVDTKRIVATINPAASSILAMHSSSVIGKTLEEVVGTENGWLAATIDKVAATGQIDLAVDADLLLDGGKRVSVNVTTVPLIDINQENLGSMLILEDITSEKRVKSTMSRYMSKEVADQLLESGEAMLAGKAQKISILFSDIRNFTTISEAIGARETVSMLNDYFGEMVDVIFRHQGILDKYIGDAIMALFGAPFARVDDADHALATANEMMVTLREVNRRRMESGKAPIGIGIGVATGEAVIGSIGSPKRMEYTAIGDSVNLASRLESATKVYGVSILLSEHTVRDLHTRTPIREIDLLRVKGKDKPVGVYEALGHHSEETFPNMARVLEEYETGLALYKERDWSGATARFEKALGFNAADKPSQIYLDRANYYAQNPPEAEWDRVWKLTEK
ncbi:MAG TPA: adenylate/guanylate cyclase domain-containing protein [Thermoanaerobaculia bacterium]|nr:adenylate/guanylate cyclase domain-containing protein [Thermoanaerobaculia bacterium]